jgi:hypothetical protein
MFPQKQRQDATDIPEFLTRFKLGSWPEILNDETESDVRPREAGSRKAASSLNGLVNSLREYAKTAAPGSNRRVSLSLDPTLDEIKKRIVRPLEFVRTNAEDVFEEPSDNVDVINLVFTPEAEDGQNVKVFPPAEVKKLKMDLNSLAGGIDLNRVVESIGDAIGGVQHVTDVQEFHTRITHHEGSQPEIVHEETKAVVRPRVGGRRAGEAEVDIISNDVQGPYSPKMSRANFNF